MWHPICDKIQLNVEVEEQPRRQDTIPADIFHAIRVTEREIQEATSRHRRADMIRHKRKLEKKLRDMQKQEGKGNELSKFRAFGI